MTTDLDASYALCRRISRQSAKNFYYSFLLLPGPRRRAMCALYAFLRQTDDLGDSEHPAETRRAALARWRASLERALAGQFDDPTLPALADTVARYAIPPGALQAVIDGVEMDLDGRAYETFAALEAYCQRVASAVGVACIHIWGFLGPEALEPARQCGIAFQLTNILRDLLEDVRRGRVYLPQEDLRRFSYTCDCLRQGVRDGRFRALMQFEIARAERFYAAGGELRRWLVPESRPVFDTMLATYRALLDEIKRRDGDVFTSRVRLSPWHKLRIAASGFLQRPRALLRSE